MLYEVKARLSPVLLVISPVMLSGVAWLPHNSLIWSLPTAIGVTTALSVLLMQMGRDQGKRKEAALYREWGGIPTTRLLRHTASTLDSFTLQRVHSKLQLLVPDVKLPTADDEQRDRQRADEIYESCVHWLREHTREKKKFPLLHAELSNYGFRRNLWGLKPIGIATSILGAAGCGMALLFSVPKSGEPAIHAWVLLALAIVTLGVWTLWITPSWVRLAADAYAKELIATTEVLPGKAE